MPQVLSQHTAVTAGFDELASVGVSHPVRARLTEALR